MLRVDETTHLRFRKYVATVLVDHNTKLSVIEALNKLLDVGEATLIMDRQSQNVFDMTRSHLVAEKEVEKKRKFDAEVKRLRKQEK